MKLQQEVNQQLNFINNYLVGRKYPAFPFNFEGKNMKIIVKDDVFDITSRIKEIDNDYFVIYDTCKKIYELHSKYQPFSSFCLSLPFDCLDERSIQKTLKTRRQNKDKIFEEIEKSNQKIEKRRYI